MSRRVAVAGVALSDVGRVDDATPYTLMAQAARRAIADAGLTVDDIDGFASTGLGTMAPIDVAEYMGFVPRWVDSTAVGGASWEVMAAHAADAIAPVTPTSCCWRTGRRLAPTSRRVCAPPTSTGAPAARCSGRRPTGTR